MTRLQHRLVWALALLGIALFVVGCERPAPELTGDATPTSGATATRPPVSTAVLTPAAPAGTAAPTRAGTQAPAGTAAPTRVPTFTPTSVPSQPTPIPPQPTQAPPTSTPRPITGPTMKVKVYMIAEGDNGKSGPKVGCNDSAVPIERTLAKSNTPLTDSIAELLSIKDKNIGLSGLYNALYQSNLSVENVTLVSARATIRLKGNVTLGGTCDAPRVVAQIRLTALQYATVKEVSVFINGVPIDQALSQR